jgi:Right handed beta helix region
MIVPMSRRQLSLVAGVAASFLIVTTGAPARSTSVACGQTLTADTTLAADLHCTSGPGLIVQAGTLALNGHIISGAGTSVGVVLAGGGTRVMGGSVLGFGTGVSVGGANAVIRGVQVANNAGIGVVFSHASGGLVDSSTITRNGGDGVLAFDLHGATVHGSTISRNGGSGIDAQLQADAGRYVGNHVTRNGGYGIVAQQSFTQAIGNLVARNAQDGIYFQETGGVVPGPVPGYLIQGNVARFNGGVGIRACVFAGGAPCTAGLTDGGGNRAYRNTGSPQCINIACSGPGLSDPPDDD